jgi:serine protease AprX
MTLTFAVRWRSSRAVVALAALIAAACVLAGAPAKSFASGDTTVVVVKDDSATQLPERAVRRLHGRVERRLALIHGFSARIPTSVVAELRRAPGVRSVTADRRVMPKQDPAAPADAAGVGTSLESARAATNATALAAAGVTGAGVDVALIDTGVSPVAGLDEPGKVVNGPDFSAQGDQENLRSLDAFGHGTHLAGIIAGEDPAAGFSGIAPDAQIVNVKVGAADGSTTLASMLAGIDWVVRNRRSDELNIRVLALAFGAPVSGGYRSDPLAFAVEQAWKRGLVVVTAAGNGGGETGSLDSPAYDPYVLAVGAEDPAGTPAVADDLIPFWSSRGDGVRNPDVVAPGVAITSLRVPGSYLDEQFPQGRIGERFFRGSGTSQATAVAAGAVSLLLQQRPELEPDQVKAMLAASASPVPGFGPVDQGAGLFDIAAAAAQPAPRVTQKFQRAGAGGGWRGTRPIGVQLTADPSMSRWTMSRWTMSRWTMSRWTMSRWTMSRWTMSRWTGGAWASVDAAPASAPTPATNAG